MNRRRVLLVEDEFIIRLLLEESLDDAGFDVVSVERGEAALDHLRGSGGFDVLMTDLNLPGDLDGTALARLARAMHPNLPILFATGEPRSGDGPDAREAVLVKPYLPSDAVAALKRLVGD